MVIGLWLGYLVIELLVIGLLVIGLLVIVDDSVFELLGYWAIELLIGYSNVGNVGNVGDCR